MKDHGALWILGVLGGLAAAAAVSSAPRGARARRTFDDLPFSATATVTKTCTASENVEIDDLDFPWNEGDDIPSEEDLEQYAESYFESYFDGLGDPCEYGDVETNVEDVDASPKYTVRTTLKGKPKVVR